MIIDEKNFLLANCRKHWFNKKMRFGYFECGRISFADPYWGATKA